MISATNEIALQGSLAYGTEVTPAEFDPPCDAFKQQRNGSLHFKAVGTQSPTTYMEVDFIPVLASALNRNGHYPLEAFMNITNQPTFANGTTCDNMIRLFNTSMTRGPAYAPVPVIGTVRANGIFPSLDSVWHGVRGVHVATPFIENNYLDCQTMKGYQDILQIGGDWSTTATQLGDSDDL
jgi:hypothetical protein